MYQNDKQMKNLFKKKIIVYHISEPKFIGLNKIIAKYMVIPGKKKTIQKN